MIVTGILLAAALAAIAWDRNADRATIVFAFSVFAIGCLLMGALELLVR